MSTHTQKKIRLLLLLLSLVCLQSIAAAALSQKDPSINPSEANKEEKIANADVEKGQAFESMHEQPRLSSYLAAFCDSLVKNQPADENERRVLLAKKV